MRYKYFSIVLVVLALGGCQTSQIKQASFETTVRPVSVNNEPVFVYNPSGKEQFIFPEIAESLQEYGYDDFCSDTKSFSCYGNKLPYNEYVGMKGYFDSDKSIYAGFSDYDFYPVILENGKKFYFVSSKKYGGKYGSSSPIMSLKLFQEIKSFKAEPLIPGSSIIVASSKVNRGSKYYTLSNGKGLSEENLKLVREVCTKYGNKPEMAELLLEMKINKDDIDYRFFISPIGSTLRSGAELYIGLNDNAEWLRFKVKYYDDDWLFVKSYKVAADDYRWQSPKISFDRDNSGGDVWEWADLSATESHVEAAKALANAKKSTIRFQGNKYYSDKLLADDQKNGIKGILRLFELMEST